jgi:hypothetical protein
MKGREEKGMRSPRRARASFPPRLESDLMEPYLLGGLGIEENGRLGGMDHARLEATLVTRANAYSQE